MKEKNASIEMNQKALSNFESATPEDIGRFIKKTRTELGIKQEQFANMLNVTRQTISNWELGKSYIDYTKASMIGLALNVHALEILLARKIDKSEIDAKLAESYKKIDDIQLKKKRITIISVITILLISVLFLLYYFFNSYNSIKIYQIELESEKYTIRNGILLISKDYIYFNLDLGNENEIKEVTLKEKKANDENLILNVDDTNLFISDHYGYEAYFKYEDIINNKTNLFIEILDQNGEIDKVNLILAKTYENNKIFFKKKTKITDGEKYIRDTPKIPMKIYEDFNLNGDNYELQVNDNEKTIYLNYMIDANAFFVTEEYKNYTNSWTYNPEIPNLMYSKSDKNNNLLEDREVDSKNDSELYQYFYNNYIKIYME